MPKKREHKEDDVTFEEAAEDTAFADDELSDAEANASKKVRDLRAKLATCQKERQEYLDGWQRQKADFFNAKRRMEEERAGDTARHTAGFVEKLIPLADSFDMALREAATESGAEWRSGVERMHTQLLGILSSLEVTVLEPTGEPFDPRFHEAVSEQPVESEAEQGTVLEVLQRGYAHGERVIRPAKVVVGRHE